MNNIPIKDELFILIYIYIYIYICTVYIRKIKLNLMVFACFVCLNISLGVKKI